MVYLGSSQRTNYITIDISYQTSHQMWDWRNKWHNPNNLIYMSNNLGVGGLTTQYYAQYQSVLYVPIMNLDADITDLMRLDLEEKDVSYLPWNVSDHKRQICMVASGDSLYVVQFGVIHSLNLATNLWDASKFMEITPACALNEETNWIYTFGYNAHLIYKYNIDTNDIAIATGTNLCNANYGRAIVHKNKKVYLQGCHISTYKTLIFDFALETFEQHTINVNNVDPGYLPYYHSGQLANGQFAILIQ